MSFQNADFSGSRGRPKIVTGVVDFSDFVIFAYCLVKSPMVDRPSTSGEKGLTLRCKN